MFEFSMGSIVSWIFLYPLSSNYSLQPVSKINTMKEKISIAQQSALVLNKQFHFLPPFVFSTSCINSKYNIFGFIFRRGSGGRGEGTGWGDWKHIFPSSSLISLYIIIFMGPFNSLNGLENSFKSKWLTWSLKLNLSCYFTVKKCYLRELSMSFKELKGPIKKICIEI